MSERPTAENDEPVGTLEQAADDMTCPECKSGKHVNCTCDVLATIDGADAWVLCWCKGVGHVWRVIPPERGDA